jgi:predicted  nucleic acid-binding Zn-ribbon protein
MGESVGMARQEQEDKNAVVKDMWKQLDSDITKLQDDIVEQNDVNNTQQNRIDHLEKVVEDLVDRITKMEDKTNTSETSSQKQTRTKPTFTAAQTTSHLKELEHRMGKFQDRLQEVEDIVLQLNDPSTQPIA